MQSTTESPTATSIATPDTNRRTKIGYDDYTNNWRESDAKEYWAADYLYLKKETHYQHIDRINAGLKNGPTWYNQAYLTAWTNRDLIDILAGNLSLTKAQKDKAISYFLNQDLGNWGIRKELVAWSVCAYTVHSDESDKRRTHPQATGDQRAEKFWEVAYSLDLAMKDRIKTYHKVESDMRG